MKMSNLENKILTEPKRECVSHFPQYITSTQKFGYIATCASCEKHYKPINLYEVRK